LSDIEVPLRPTVKNCLYVVATRPEIKLPV
jgi:hypothetical protein